MENRMFSGFGLAERMPDDNDVQLLLDSAPDILAKRRAGGMFHPEGVSNVKEALDINTAIVAWVTAALLADPPTRLTTVEVVNEQGVVTLKGQVDSPEVREAAEEIAAHQSGVSAVINVLEVKPKIEFLKSRHYENC